MKTILVPTDFSENANNALHYAIKLAKKEKAKIILLHAFHFTYVYPEMPLQFLTEQIKTAEQLASNQLKLLCKKVEKSGECEFINQESLPVDLILDTIKKKKPDLVVMSTTGASGLKKIFMGSITAKIVEKATCPVIAVPEKTEFSPIKNITYATDYYMSDINALSKIVEIAKLFNAKITMLHVCYDMLTHDTEEEYMSTFKSKVENDIQYSNMAYKLVYGDNLIDVLEDYIKNESPDLISMSTHYRNLFEKLFDANSTKKMTYHTKVPFLAFHFEQIPIEF